MTKRNDRQTTELAKRLAKLAEVRSIFLPSIPNFSVQISTFYISIMILTTFTISFVCKFRHPIDTKHFAYFPSISLLIGIGLALYDP